MAAGPSITGIEGWRVALLLVGFIIVTLTFEGLIENIEKKLKKRKGLLTAFRALKNELLYLGFLSLLLTVTQEYLARICISYTDGSTYKKYKEKYNLTDQCGDGKEPLWPVSVQHETHYFIFTVAVTHILYCALTIALTLHKVGKWRRWEDEALAEARSNCGDVKVMQENVSTSLIRSMCTSALTTLAPTTRTRIALAHLQAFSSSLAAQFRVSVSQPMYHNVRLMFIEKMGLAYDFDYHALVTNGMESTLARVVHASWPLWLIAVVFLSLPTPSYVPFWSYILVIGLMLAVGAKLVSVTALLAMQVAIKYGDSVLFGRMDAEPRVLKRSGIGRRRMSLSQLDESLGDVGEGADGAGGGAEGGGGGEAGAASAATGAGAHVLDEALPADAGAEMAAQVAAITALSNRQQALNMLRTMAAQPLVPDPVMLAPDVLQVTTTPPPSEPATSPSAAAATPTAANLLPSPSVMLKIAPPRWGAPPPRSEPHQPISPQPPSAPPSETPAPTATVTPIDPNNQPTDKKPDIAIVVPPDITGSITPTPTAGPALTASSVASPSPVSVAGGASVTSQVPYTAPVVSQGTTSQLTATLPSTSPPPPLPPRATSALMRSTAAGGGDGSALLAASLRPGSRALLAVAAATSWANATAGGGGLRQRGTYRRNGALALCGVASRRVTSALEHMEEAIALAAAFPTPGAVPTPAPGASTPTSPGDIPTTPLTGTPQSTTSGGGGPAAASAPPQLGTFRGLIASLRPSRKSRTSETQSVRTTDTQVPYVTSRPSTAATPSGLDAGLGTTRRAVSPWEGTMSRLGLTGVMSPVSGGSTTLSSGGAGAGGGGTAAATMGPGQASLQAAAAAAAFLRQMPPRKPLRRCMSARQLMHGKRLLDDDVDGDAAAYDNLSRTMVRRNKPTYPGLGAAVTGTGTVVHAVAAGGAIAANGHMATARPTVSGGGGGDKYDAAVGLTVGQDLLPPTNFRPLSDGGGAAASPSTSPPPPVSPSAALALLPKIAQLRIFRGRKKMKGTDTKAVSADVQMKAQSQEDQERGQETKGLQEGSTTAPAAAVQASSLAPAATVPSVDPVPSSALVAAAGDASGPQQLNAAFTVGGTTDGTDVMTVGPTATAPAILDEQQQQPTVVDALTVPEGSESAVLAASGASTNPTAVCRKSAFAQFQIYGESEQQDLSAVYDALSPLLPPGNGALPGWVSGASTAAAVAGGGGPGHVIIAVAPPLPSPASLEEGPQASVVADGGVSYITSGEPDGGSRAVTSGRRDDIVDPAEGLGGDGDGAVQLQPPSLRREFGGVRRTATPTLLVSPRPLGAVQGTGPYDGGLRVVRLVGSNAWLTEDEALRQTHGTGAATPDGGTGLDDGSGLGLEVADLVRGTSSNGTEQPPKSLTSISSVGRQREITSYLPEEPSLEAPSPAPSITEMEPRALTSVFSLHYPARCNSDDVSPTVSYGSASRPRGLSEATPAQRQQHAYEKAGGGAAGSDAVRAAAAVDVSGELPAVEMAVDGSQPLVGPSRHERHVRLSPEVLEREYGNEASSVNLTAMVSGVVSTRAMAELQDTLPETLTAAATAGATPTEPAALFEGDGEEACDERGEPAEVGYGIESVDIETAEPLMYGSGEAFAAADGDGDVEYDVFVGDGAGAEDEAAATVAGYGTEFVYDADAGVDGECMEGDEMDGTFGGFGNVAVDLESTAPHIGCRTGDGGGSRSGSASGRVTSPPDSASRAPAAFPTRAFGSTVSLASFVPSGAAAGIDDELAASGDALNMAPSDPLQGRPESASTSPSLATDTAAVPGRRLSGTGTESTTSSRTAAVQGLPMQVVEEEEECAAPQAAEAAEDIPPPPVAPLPPPPSPPPPAHLRLHVRHEQAAAGGAAAARNVCGDVGFPNSDGRWAVLVSSPAQLRAADSVSRSAQQHHYGGIITGDSAVRECSVLSCEDGISGDAAAGVPPVRSRRSDAALLQGPICEGSTAVGRDDVLLPVTPSYSPASAAPSGPEPPLPAVHGQGDERGDTSTAVTAAGDADGGGRSPAVHWRFADASKLPTNDGASASGVEGQMGSPSQPQTHTMHDFLDFHALRRHFSRSPSHSQHPQSHHHNHFHLFPHHHNHHGGPASDSDSDDDGVFCWPPCVPKPWGRTLSGRRVLPLPAAVQDLADNLGAGVDRAKSVIASAADNVSNAAGRRLKSVGFFPGGSSGSLTGGQRKLADHWLDRVRRVLADHKGFENMDASQFFWFHNPKVIAYLFNWAYYENSLSLALLIFSLVLGYQQQWVFTGVKLWAVLTLLAADFLILVHSCLYVLPLYALITPVGAHCPKEVLRRALKAGVYTRQMAVIAKAMHLQLKAREIRSRTNSPTNLLGRMNRWRTEHTTGGGTGTGGVMAGGAPSPATAFGLSTAVWSPSAAGAGGLEELMRSLPLSPRGDAAVMVAGGVADDLSATKGAGALDPNATSTSVAVNAAAAVGGGRDYAVPSGGAGGGSGINSLSHHKGQATTGPTTGRVPVGADSGDPLPLLLRESISLAPFPHNQHYLGPDSVLGTSVSPSSSSAQSAPPGAMVNRPKYPQRPERGPAAATSSTGPAAAAAGPAVSMVLGPGMRPRGPPAPGLPDAGTGPAPPPSLGTAAVVGSLVVETPARPLRGGPGQPPPHPRAHPYPHPHPNALLEGPPDGLLNQLPGPLAPRPVKKQQQQAAQQGPHEHHPPMAAPALKIPRSLGKGAAAAAAKTQPGTAPGSVTAQANTSGGVTSQGVDDVQPFPHVVHSPVGTAAAAAGPPFAAATGRGRGRGRGHARGPGPGAAARLGVGRHAALPNAVVTEGSGSGLGTVDSGPGEELVEGSGRALGPSLDLSLLPGSGGRGSGTGLEAEDSEDSLSSSFGRSGTITALLGGMYRGAVTHLTPEEQRAAAITAAVAAGRAAAGRGGRSVGGRGRGRVALDMTLVPDQ